MTTCRRSALGAIALIVAVHGPAARDQAPAPEAAPAPAAFTLSLPVPGLAATDGTPNACVDCHAQQGERDFCLSTLVGALGRGASEDQLAKARAAAPPGVEPTGRHPALRPEAFANVPGACMRCHRKESDSAPPFTRLAHLIHLTDGGENLFLEQAGGSCGSCYKLDPATGQWRIPSAPEK